MWVGTARDERADATHPRIAQEAIVPRTLQDVVFVDGVRTPFGKAGEKGIYAQTRADDLVIKCIRELLRRNPNLPKDKVEEVAIATGCVPVR